MTPEHIRVLVKGGLLGLPAPPHHRGRWFKGEHIRIALPSGDGVRCRVMRNENGRLIVRKT